MKCGRVQLQERAKQRDLDQKQAASDKPRRYCQKRLVNPDHEEDPRWIDVLERFRCNEPHITTPEHTNSPKSSTQDNLYLSVQTLQFKGEEQHGKRQRTGFKYTTVADGNMHRMFVKQAVVEATEDVDSGDEDRSSQLTCYFYDDYEKYLTNASRPPSEKSGIFSEGVGTKFRANKAVQVDFSKNDGEKNTRKAGSKNSTVNVEDTKKFCSDLSDDLIEDTKISFHKSGKRKSLTISRTQSPETVQVIRVDVVCSRSAGASPGSISTPADEYIRPTKQTDGRREGKLDKKTENLHINHPHFASKYFLANSIKTLDENVAGGAKVTLLCKTFRLSDRSRMLFNKKPLDIAKLTSKVNLAK